MNMFPNPLVSTHAMDPLDLEAFFPLMILAVFLNKEIQQSQRKKLFYEMPKCMCVQYSQIVILSRSGYKKDQMYCRYHLTEEVSILLGTRLFEVILLGFEYRYQALTIVSGNHLFPISFLWLLALDSRLQKCVFFIFNLY